MAVLVGRELPRRLLRSLGGDVDKQHGKVILVLTTDREGWPHVAMLSHWEVFARDVANIRIATYASSRTTKNLLRTGKVTMVLADKGMAYYIKGTASPRASPTQDSNRFFNVKVKMVMEDELPGASITTGIRYTEERKVEPHRPIRRELEKPWRRC